MHISVKVTSRSVMCLARPKKQIGQIGCAWKKYAFRVDTFFVVGARNSWVRTNIIGANRTNRCLKQKRIVICLCIAL